MSRADAIEAFRKAVIEAGLRPGEIVPDGRFHRCGTADRPKGDSGWILLYDDPPAGAYGDWRTGLSKTWSGGNGRELDPGTRKRIKQKIEAEKKARAEEEAARHAKAAEETKRILISCPDADDTTPYLQKKGVHSVPGLKRDGNDLVIPVLDPRDSQPMSLQRIAPDGEKRFLPGGKTRGGYFSIRGIDEGPLYLAEGIATALSIHEASGKTVLCAFNAGNLEAVARMARKRYPRRDIILCADDDRTTGRRTGTNPGIEAAEKAAKAARGRVVKPGLDGDFNDLHQKRGPRAVRRRLGVDGDPLAFPEEVIGGAAGLFADTFAERMESPRHFFFMSYLTCLGAVIGDRVTLASEIRPQPRLYLVLIGQSADDRKSTALHKTADLWRDTVESFSVCHGVGSEVGLQKKILETPNLLLVFDEFKQFASKARIENSALLPCVNTLFESNRYENRTKKSNLSIDGGHLSLLAASTVQTYEALWTSQFIDIGFTNRLFLVPGSGSRRFPIPEKVPEEEKRELRRDIGRILEHANEHRELRITNEGRAIYEDWYKQLEGIHAKRLDTYAARFMILLAVNELKPEIDEEIVRKVLDLMDWQYEVRAQHDPVDAENTTAKMEEKIRRVLKKGPHSERDLKRAVNANRAGLWIYTAALKNLQGAEEVSWDPRQKKWIG